MRSFLIVGGLVAAAQAFTPPKDATWGPLVKPDLSSPVTQGQTFQVTWDPESHPTDGVTVSLVLCRGPSTNCVTDSTAIVEGVSAAAKSYSWDVPCSLSAGTQSTDTGYGMLIIVDGTGEFQYSTQFSVLANDKCGSSSGSSGSASASGSGWGPGSGSWSTKGWGSSYPSNATATYSHSYAPSTTVYASSTPADFSTVAVSTSVYATATFNAPSGPASTFTGAAVQPTGNAANVLGLVAGGALAMLAL